LNSKREKKDDPSTLHDIQWQLIDGQHRLEALCDAGVERAECVIVPADDATARRMSETLNGVRGRPSCDLLGANLAEMVHLGLEPLEVSSLTAIPVPRIEELVALADLDAPRPGEMPKAEPEEEWHGKTFRLSADMKLVVEQALEKAKRLADTDSEALALTRICADFLAGPDESYE